MALKKKIFLFISGLSLAFLLLFLLANRLTIFRSQAEQKTILARKVASRVARIVESEKKRIATLCADWAAWDSMFEYAANPTTQFERELSLAAVADSSDLSLVLVSDRSGAPLCQSGLERSSGRQVRFDMKGNGRNQLGDFFRQSLAVPDRNDFIVASEFGPLLAVSAPITRSDGSGPPRGRVLMARLFDPDFNLGISTTIQERSYLRSLTALAGENSQQQYQELLDNGMLLKENNRCLEIFILFSDPRGQPVFAVKVEADNTQFRMQERAVLYFLVSVLFCTLLAGTLFYRFINHVLLKRLQAISRRTSGITTSADLSVRLPEERRDEITQLSRTINTMLERLQNENTHRREMEERLVMNEKLVATGRLAANIAHEVNNPLFAIANSIAVIKKQIRHIGGDIGEVLPLAEKEIARVRKITRKLLDYGKVNLETFTESDLHAILDTACDVLKLSRQTGSTAVIREGETNAAPLFANPDSLQQVFMNLIVNASEAMDGGGEVRIAVERRGEAYDMHFRDTGPGFPTGIRKRIFEPFNSSKEVKGAGLGLYISYHIVQRHGGHMALGDSAAGAHVIVTLPRRGGAQDER